MFKALMTGLLCSMLGGCATRVPPEGYPVCSTQPGTYACQVEQYRNADQ